VDGENYGAKYYAQEAAAYDADAQVRSASAAASSADACTAAESAVGAATLAQAWASQTSGPVDGLDHSAKYYATTAANSAVRAQTAATTVTGQAVVVARNASLAQAWAAQLTGTVGGTSFCSAYYYAQQAAAANSDARNQADSAAASASSAASSASDADSSAASIQAAFQTFNSLWLGRHSTRPTVDGNGDPLQAGAEYEDSSQDPHILMVYDGSEWVAQNGDAARASSNAQLAAAQAAASAAYAAGNATGAADSASLAQTAAGNAGRSATAADTSASAAYASAEVARDSASTAIDQATRAGQSASAASDSAGAASDSAASASSAASTASNQASLAQAWASQGSGLVNGSDYHSAYYYARQAALSDSDAKAQASAAAASLSLAQAWAAQPSGAVDGTSFYSASYYAAQAGGSAADAATSASAANAWATNAGVSAANAAASAVSGSASADSAATHAASASTSADDAENSAADARNSVLEASGAASRSAASSASASDFASEAGSSARSASESAASASSAANDAEASAAASASAATAAQSAIHQANSIAPFCMTGGTITLTPEEAAPGVFRVTGRLTDNATICMPPIPHVVIVENLTTDRYTLSVAMTDGSAVVAVPQGKAMQIFCDGTSGVYSVSSVSGLQFSGIKPIAATGTVMDSTYAGSYTPLSAPGAGNQAMLPSGATMEPGRSVFVDSLLGNWVLRANGSDTADFGNFLPVNEGDKFAVTWNGTSWRTTLYANWANPVFDVSVSAPIAYVSNRLLLGAVADDGVTPLQSSGGATFGGPVLIPTQPTGDNSLAGANTAFVHATVAALLASSPALLDTLNELAATLSADSSLATTIVDLIASKAALNGAAFRGPVSAPNLISTGGSVSAYGWGGSMQQGRVYLSQDGNHLLSWDGETYALPNGPLRVSALHLTDAGMTYPDGTEQTTAYNPQTIAQLISTVQDLSSKVEAQALEIAQLKASQQ
jgi:hypothetical protein